MEWPEYDMSEAPETRLARLEAAVATFSRIEGKIDQIAASSAMVAQQVAGLEQAHRGHSSGLERAFGEIKEIKITRDADVKDFARTLAEHMRDDDVTHGAISEKVDICVKSVSELKIDVEKKAAWIDGVASSAKLWWAASGAVVMAVLGWAAIKILSMSDKVLILEQKIGVAG